MSKQEIMAYAKRNMRDGYNSIEMIEYYVDKAWNAALDEAAEKAKTRTNDESTSIIVDKQSILDLKIKEV